MSAGLTDQLRISRALQAHKGFGAHDRVHLCLGRSGQRRFQSVPQPGYANLDEAELSNYSYFVNSLKLQASLQQSTKKIRKNSLPKKLLEAINIAVFIRTDFKLLSLKK